MKFVFIGMSFFLLNFFPVLPVLAQNTSFWDNGYQGEDIDSMIDKLQGELEQEVERFNEYALALAHEANSRHIPFDLKAYQERVDLAWPVIQYITDKIAELSAGDPEVVKDMKKTRDVFEGLVKNTISKVQERDGLNPPECTVQSTSVTGSPALENMHETVDADLIVNSVLDNKLKQGRLNRQGVFGQSSSWTNYVQSQVTVSDPVVEINTGSYRITFNPQTLEISSHGREIVEHARPFLPEPILGLIETYFFQLEEELLKRFNKRDRIDGYPTMEDAYINSDHVQYRMEDVMRLVQKYFPDNREEDKTELIQKLHDMSQAVRSWIEVYDQFMIHQEYVHCVQYFLNQEVSLEKLHKMLFGWSYKMLRAFGLAPKSVAKLLIRSVHARAVHWVKLGRNRAEFNLSIMSQIEKALSVEVAPLQIGERARVGLSGALAKAAKTIQGVSVAQDVFMDSASERAARGVLEMVCRDSSLFQPGSINAKALEAIRTKVFEGMDPNVLDAERADMLIAQHFLRMKEGVPWSLETLRPFVKTLFLDAIRKTKL